MNVFWEDQSRAASRDANNFVSNVAEWLRGIGELSQKLDKFTLGHARMAERLSTERVLGCPHSMGSPKPLLYSPNLGLVSCDEDECLDVIYSHLSQEDDRCDWCDKVPSNNQFAPVMLALGPISVVGHQCDDCVRAMTAEASEEVKKKYFDDHSR